MKRWKHRPEGSTWGDWGDDDQLGRLLVGHVRDALGELPRLIGHPTVDLAPAKTPGGHGMGRGKLWIQGHGLVK